MIKYLNIMLNLYSNSNSKRPFAGLRGANTWFAAPIESICAALRHQAESSSGQRPTGTKIMVTNSKEPSHQSPRLGSDKNYIFVLFDIILVSRKIRSYVLVPRERIGES
jgi:hypothetical protein